MKKIMLFILCLALMSLACLQTAAGIADPAQTGTATPADVTVTATSGLDTLLSTVTTRPSTQCARVIASDALNVRQAADDQAVVLAWLKNNQIVVIADTSNPDWWRIESPVLNGYVRSVYLQRVECEP